MPPTRSLLLLLLAAFLVLAAHASRADGPPDAVNLDKDWRLQLDTNAPWRDDALYLPEETADLAKLPLNQPTGGWTALDEKAGVAVSLPATVEQFYWGKAPNKVSDPKRAEDVVNFNGTYEGVSWWYRMFLPPDLKPGQRLFLSFPGARQRAEVYVNGQLVAYNLIAETPFSADITKAVLPGAPNQLAVRVTDPGGTLTPADDTLLPWGKYTIPASHGFGGLDGGVTLAVRGPVAVSDVSVSNHTDPRAVSIHVEVASGGPDYNGPVIVSILRNNQEVWTGRADVQVPAGGSDEAIVEARLPDAELWDFSHPALYTARARLDPDDHTARDVTFGFRWFTADGVGKNARFRLNGRRVVLRAADSDGFWAPNGLFPDRAAADRETAAALACGLNAIFDRRHFPKPATLDACDSAGLGRWCEPGGGIFCLRDTPGGFPPPGKGAIDTSGDGGAPGAWFNRYEAAKALSLVRAYRSHPSVLAWTLVGGTNTGDLHNPKVFYTLRRMHELDPARAVVLRSGGSPNNQAWLPPYATEFQFDNGKGGSGWHDEGTPDTCPGIPPIPRHAVAVYQDGMYLAPDHFSYRAPTEKEIAAWGEAAAGASADDHGEITKWYEKNGNAGYDRAAHETLADAYEKALDRYEFRKTFRTAADLYKQIAAKQYFLAARLLENARLSDANDLFALSGWESTATAGHAGLVDALRHLKGDPAPLKAAAAPALLVVRPRHYVVAKGDAATVDVHLINETNLRGAFALLVNATLEGDKKPFFEEQYLANPAGGERYGELLKDDIHFTVSKPGLVKVTAALVPMEGDQHTPVLTRTESLWVVDTAPEPIKKTVATVGEAGSLSAALEAQLGVKAVPLAEAKGKVDDILLDTNLWQYEKADAITNTTDPGLYKEQFSHGPGEILSVRGLTAGSLQVELFFAEPHWERPGQRVFDVALNGQTVLEKFDLVAAANGQRRVAVTRTFTADAPDGTLKVTVPKVYADRALFAAVRVTDSQGKIVAEVFRANDYAGKDKTLWKAAELAGFDWKAMLPTLLDKVKAGSRLIVLSSGGQDAALDAAALADAKLLTYRGMVGQNEPSSQGFWYFGKKHWLLDGLPNGGAGVLDWPYQITAGDGALMTSPNLETVVAYGRDHSLEIGVGAAVLPHGKGQIVLLGLQGLEESFVNNLDLGFQPVTARRIMYNTLK